MMPPGLNFTTDVEAIEDFVDAPHRTADPVEAAQPDVVPLRVLDALLYDFDIVDIPPDPAQQAHLDALRALGQDVDDTNVEARWRDPQTARALSQASLGVRELFKKAGFGTAISGRRTPSGHHDRADDPTRHDVIMRLTNAMSEANADNFDWGQFDCAAFFKAHAESVATGGVAVPEQSTRRPDRKRSIALLGLLIGIGLLMVAGLTAL